MLKVSHLYHLQNINLSLFHPYNLFQKPLLLTIQIGYPEIYMELITIKGGSMSKKLLALTSLLIMNGQTFTASMTDILLFESEEVIKKAQYIANLNQDIQKIKSELSNLQLLLKDPYINTDEAVTESMLERQEKLVARLLSIETELEYVLAKQE